MKEELDKQLCKEFPNLYADRFRSMQETCMCWGFECDEGWFDLIYNLSSKLEKLIIQWKEQHKEEMTCESCLRSQKEHSQFYHIDEDDGSYIRINDIVEFTSMNYLSSDKVLQCKEFKPSFPKASQVKEKYGTLRFYMTYETEEMSKLINEAETLSEVTCEDCGREGELCSTNGRAGWLRTLCADCVNESNGKYKPVKEK